MDVQQALLQLEKEFEEMWEKREGKIAPQYRIWEWERSTYVEKDGRVMRLVGPTPIELQTELEEYKYEKFYWIARELFNRVPYEDWYAYCVQFKALGTWLNKKEFARRRDNCVLQSD